LEERSVCLILSKLLRTICTRELLHDTNVAYFTAKSHWRPYCEVSCSGKYSTGPVLPLWCQGCRHSRQWWVVWRGNKETHGPTLSADNYGSCVTGFRKTYSLTTYTAHSDCFLYSYILAYRMFCLFRCECLTRRTGNNQTKLNYSAVAAAEAAVLVA